MELSTFISRHDGDDSGGHRSAAGAPVSSSGGARGSASVRGGADGNSDDSNGPGSDDGRGGDQGLIVEKARPKLKPPPMFKVLLINDDYTPMEFVVQILEIFFAMDREKATQVMLHVHRLGKGVCGIYTRDMAETKVAQVNDFSRSHQHPLLCTMEEA